MISRPIRQARCTVAMLALKSPSAVVPAANDQQFVHAPRRMSTIRAMQETLVPGSAILLLRTCGGTDNNAHHADRSEFDARREESYALFRPLLRDYME
jgi:hypothetical protein